MSTRIKTATYTLPISTSADERDETSTKIWAYHIAGELLAISSALTCASLAYGVHATNQSLLYAGTALLVWFILQLSSGLYRWENLMKHQAAFRSSLTLIPWMFILLGAAHLLSIPKSLTNTLLLSAAISAPLVILWREFAHLETLTPSSGKGPQRCAGPRLESTG